jgi:hypothetical protein
MPSPAYRPACDVLDDHLRKRKDGLFEEDLAENYSPDIVMLIAAGVFRGHDGVRELGRRLHDELPDCRFAYTTRLVEGEIGFLEWRAQSAHSHVDDGADSYLIRDGRIVVQTIHYTVKPGPGPDLGTDE